MSFPRYLSYKDSGVEWLGEVPCGWAVRPLKHLARLQTGMTPPTDDLGNYTEDEVFHWVRPEDLNETGAPTKASKFLTEQGWSQTRQIKAGSSLICCIGTIGKVGMTNDAVSTNQQITAAVPREGSRYLFYAISSGRTELELASTGNVLRILNTERLGNISFPNPPLVEQTQIAAFLDRETAKIDELVAEQRRLMELLKEKRQAVISHAVTQGLNPDAPMKPSGIEWLGEVPAHWEVRKLKFLCNVQTGDKDTENAVEDGLYPFFVRSQTVERINSTAFDCEAILTAGDGVGVGKVFHYHNGPFDFHQRVYMMNNFREVSGPYLFHFFRENFYKVALEGGAKSTVDSLRRPVFMNFTVCVPPKAEQAAIVTTVEREAEKFDTLTAEAQRAIDLLQERRTALISAAVTGQIDVRQLSQTQKVGAGETATQEASKLVNLPHENHTRPTR